MLVGHFLGLDHIGHTYSSVSTAQMGYKLKQISEFLEDTIDKMDNKTILLIVGDHGMKDDGNHGGGSREEIETVFFAYSKQELQKDSPRNICYQADVTPTLSILLNTPLPVNSLGDILPSAIPKSLGLNLSEARSKLQSHVASVLDRLDVSYSPGQEIEVGR